MNQKTHVTLASFAQSHEKFGLSAGKQCTGMSLAFAMYTQMKRVEDLTKRDLDIILDLGNDVYVQSSSFYETELLAPEEIPREITYQGVRYICKVGNFRYGFISDVRNLTFNLTNMFCMYTDIFFVCKGKTSFIKYSAGQYYLYDSHKKDQHGNVHPDGKSSLIRFSQFHDMVGYLARHYKGVQLEQYDLVPLVLNREIAKSTDPRRVKCTFKKTGPKLVNTYASNVLSENAGRQRVPSSCNTSSGTESEGSRQKKSVKRNRDKAHGQSQSPSDMKAQKKRKSNSYDDVLTAARMKKRDAETCVVGPSNSLVYIDNEPVETYSEGRNVTSTESDAQESVSSKKNNKPTHLKYKCRHGKKEGLTYQDKQKEKILGAKEVNDINELLDTVNGQEHETITLQKVAGVWTVKPKKKKKMVSPAVSPVKGQPTVPLDVHHPSTPGKSYDVPNSTSESETNSKSQKFEDFRKVRSRLLRENPDITEGEIAEKKQEHQEARKKYLYEQRKLNVDKSTSETEVLSDCDICETFAKVKRRILKENPGITSDELAKIKKEHDKKRRKYLSAKKKVDHQHNESSDQSDTTEIVNKVNRGDPVKKNNVPVNLNISKPEDFRLVKRRLLAENPNITEEEIQEKRKEHQLQKKKYYREYNALVNLPTSTKDTQSETDNESEMCNSTKRSTSNMIKWPQKKRMLLLANPNITPEELEEAKTQHTFELKQINQKRARERAREKKGPPKNKNPMVDMSYINTHYGNPCAIALNIQENVVFNSEKGIYEYISQGQHVPVEQQETIIPDDALNKHINSNVPIHGANIPSAEILQQCDQNIVRHESTEPQTLNGIYSESERPLGINGNTVLPNINVPVVPEQSDVLPPTPIEPLNGNILITDNQVNQHVVGAENNGNSENNDCHSINSELENRDFNVEDNIPHVPNIEDIIIPANLIVRLNQSVSEMCTFCTKLCFPEQVTTVSEAQRPRYNIYLPENQRHEPIHVCSSCKTQISRNRIPRFSQYPTPKYPELPNELKLSPHEERLIALRLPFMHIRILPTGGQQSLRGNVILVPADVNETLYQLPRHINDQGTVTVKLKRKLEYTSVYEQSNVRPLKVLQAIYWLQQHSELYQRLNVGINATWLERTITELENQNNFAYEAEAADNRQNAGDMPVENNGVPDGHPELQIQDAQNRLVGDSQPNELQNLEIVEIADLRNVVQISEHIPNNDTDYVSESDNDPRCYNEDIENRYIQRILNNDNSDLPSTEHNNVQNNDTDDEDDAPDNFSEIDNREIPAIHDTLIDMENLDSELNIAPGQGQTPLNILYDDNAEELCFPTLYCGQSIQDIYGNLSFLDRTRWELQCKDRRIAQRTELIFLKYKRYQMDYVRSQARFSMRFIPQSAPYTAKDVKTDDDRQNIATVDNGYYFFRKLRNSPQYLQQKKRELFATIRQLGLPTFFVSLSAADIRWKELLKSLAKIIDNKDYTDDEIEALSYVEKTRLINSDPITAARYFDRRFQFFLKEIIYKPPYPLGQISHHFYRVEFQHRGSPHIHMIVFSDTAPKYKKRGNNQDVCDYIDKYISCSLTPYLGNEEFLKFQVHKHSKTCRKGGRAQCRFHYPLPPFDRTLILTPNSSRTDKQLEMYKEIQKYLDSENITENTTLDDILAHFKINYDDYVLVVRATLKNERVFLKRKPNECRVNMYMRNLLQVWEANMDCQFCLDPYSVVNYIVNYINKENRGLSLNLQQMTKQCERQKKNIRETIKKLGNVFCNTSEVCVQEAVYVLLGMHLTYQSIDVVSINTNIPEKRTKLLKNEKELQDLPENSTDIYQSTTFELYSQRPIYFEDFSFSDYVAMVKITPRSETCQAKNRVGFYNVRNTQYWLDETKRYTIGRRRILSYICPPKDKEKEEFYRIHILLFLPWRQEPKLPNPNTTFAQVFDNLPARHQYRIMENAKLYNKQKMDELYDIYTEMSNNADDLLLQPSSDLANAEDLELGSVTLNGGSFFRPITDNLLEHSSENNFDAHLNQNQTLYNINQQWPLEEILDSVNRLNAGQKAIYDHIMKNMIQSDTKMHIFVSGGAGTGKTLLLQTLYQSISRMYNLSPDHTPDVQKVLKLANTGKAAFLIRGKTVHGGLAIMPKDSYEYYDRLSADQLNTLHVKFLQTKVIMIDEISLIGTRFFRYIDLRLQEIMGIREPFGGLHVFCFGDLYQLPPVKDKWIFENTKYGMSSLAINQWNERFQIYELNEIMRQKEEQSFAELLNRMRVNTLSQDDIRKLEERSIATDQYNDGLTCPHLFAKNTSVTKYNASVFQRANTYKEIVQSVDTLVNTENPAKRKKIDDKLEKDEIRQSTYRYLRLGIGLTYEITQNINIEDGLTNGTSGILKYIQHRPDYEKPIALWLKLEEPEIGQVQRHIYRHYRSQEIDKSWTPIFATTIEFRITDPSAKIRRKQFPLVQATGKTVHKAQGCTLPEVAIALHDHTFRNGFYVACSRVPLLSKLHIINFSLNQICPDKKVGTEMLRLKAERSLTLNSQVFPLDGVNVNIYYCNVQSLYSHFKYIQNDKIIEKCTVILLNESHLINSDNNEDFRIPGFNIFRYDAPILGNVRRPSNGLIMYIQEQYDVALIFQKRTAFYEYMCHEIMNNWSNLVIILVYVKPNNSNHNIGTLLIELMERVQQIQHVVIFGDFNIDLQDTNSRNFVHSIISDHGFTLNRAGITTKGKTELDFCISKRPLDLYSHFLMHSYHMALTTQYRT